MRTRYALRAALPLPLLVLLAGGCADDAVAPPPEPVMLSLTSREACMDDGWRAFGFENQGQCIRYIETGQDSRPITAEEEGGEGYAPGRVGQVRTIEIGDFALTYEVIDGLAIFEGDMILGTAAEVAEWGRATDVNVESQANILHGQVCFSYFARSSVCRDYRWPNGVIPYEVRLDTWDPADRETIDSQIRNAIAYWEQQTGLVLVPRSTESDYVRFRRSDDEGACWSKFGRQGGRQDIGLTPGGCGFGPTVHEIGHALGFAHEQSRDDRDGFVEILWDNIENKRRSQFEKSGMTRDSWVYDFASIMHYGPRAFGIRDQLNPETGLFNRRRITIRARAGDPEIGQRETLSAGDIRAAYVMYGTPPEIEITDPRDGRIISYRSNVDFRATVRDWAGRTPIFDLGPTVSWFSPLQIIGTGPTVTTRLTLPAGVDEITHLVTAVAEDLSLKTAEASVRVIVRNHPPTANIQSPLPASLIYRGVPITLRGITLDPDGGPITCRWTSSNAGDPFPVDGCEPTVTFPTGGNRTLTLTATDERNTSASASVGITVQDEAPAIIVAIDSPPDGEFIFRDEPIELSGVATGGEAPHSYRWTVNWPYDATTGTDGPNTAEIGTGQTRNWTLEDTVPDADLTCAVLSFKITLEATDNTGLTGSHFIVLHFAHVC